jgi:hypothetical protein
VTGNHHISLVVKSTAGTWDDARFNIENKAEKVLDDGIKHFHLDPTPSSPYVLIRESTGESLPLAEKLKDIGLVDAEVVVIQAGTPVDG